jgi:anti-anti-sigma regulatory factor
VQNTHLLPSEVSIYTASELRSQWLAWLGEAPHHDSGPDEVLRVDAAAVGEIDAAGLQLLLSLSKALAQRQRSLLLVNPSQPLVKACAALGVAKLLVDTDMLGATP